VPQVSRLRPGILLVKAHCVVFLQRLLRGDSTARGNASEDRFKTRFGIYGLCTGLTWRSSLPPDWCRRSIAEGLQGNLLLYQEQVASTASYLQHRTLVILRTVNLSFLLTRLANRRRAIPFFVFDDRMRSKRSWCKPSHVIE
jgi:hypothetical protein